MGISWQLEDLNADIINSRKLSIKGIVTLEIKVESLVDTEAAVDIGSVEDEEDGIPQVETRLLHEGSE